MTIFMITGQRIIVKKRIVHRLQLFFSLKKLTDGKQKIDKRLANGFNSKGCFAKREGEEYEDNS